MGKASPSSVVLDAGALIAFARGDAHMRALVREALVKGPTTVVPVLDQVLSEASGATVVTSDIEHPRRLDPRIRLERI